MEEPKIVLKWAYHALSIGLMAAMVIPQALIVCLIWKLMGFKSNPIGVVTFTNLLSVNLGMRAADRIFKRYGLSRSGRVVEVRGRSSLEPGGEVGPDEVVEVYVAPGTKRSVVVTSLLFAALLACGLFAPWKPEEAGLRWVLLALSVSIAGWVVWILRRWRTPLVRADRDGIAGTDAQHPSVRDSLSWFEIGTCEIETVHDTLGRPIRLRTLLKHQGGDTLMILHLESASVADRDRLLKYIRAKLPKARVDPWEV